jgi:hypothetical protein
MKQKQTSLLGFIVAFTGYAIVIAGGALALQDWLQPTAVLSPNFWLLLGFLYFLTLIVYVLSVLGIKRGGEAGVLSILGGIIIKFLLAASLFLVILLKSNENQLVLGLNFFSIYLLFTVFEVIFLLRILRHQN